MLWCVVIFMFSANNADESNKQSNAVFNAVIEFVNPVYDSLDTTAQAEYKDTATFIIRKLAHFSEYALLGILAFINLAMVKKLGYRGLFAAVFSCIYASSDEIHQLFVPGRAGQVRDVLIDTSGAVAGTSNVITEVLVELDKALRNGEIEKAEKLQKDIDVLRGVLKLGTVPVVMKRAAELAGIAEIGPARKPVLECSAQDDEKIKEMLQHYHLI